MNAVLMSLPTLTRHKIIFLSFPQPPFFLWHPVPFYPSPFASIWAAAPLGWWMCLISHLDLSTIRSRALCLSCSRSLDTHIWKHVHRHTLNSPVHTLSDAQSVNWRPSFNGKHPMRPHCMCIWETLRIWERGRKSEKVHTLSLMRVVYY